MKKTENKYYKENKAKWKYAWEHYTGKYAELESDGGSIRDYLQQKYQRENNKAYDERLKVTDPVLHFATVVDGMNGIMANNDMRITRTFGRLGDSEGQPEKGTVAKKIWENADLQGTNWEPLMKEAGIKLTVLHDVWGLVEGVTDTEEAHVKIINPLDVVDWYPENGSLEQVLVKEQRDNRVDIFDGNDDQETYTLFTLDGFFRYVETDEGMEQIASGEYEYWSDSSLKKKILPIFRTRIPFPRHIGYQLALKENHIFNKKSVRDFALRNLSFSILNLSVDSQEEYLSIKEALKAGANMLPSYGDKNHQFIQPDGGYLADFQAVLEKDVEDFYFNGFKKYAESASQVTATSARLESHSGIEAFLSLLVTSMDEFEKQCLRRLEQVYFDDASRWGEAYVERSTDFTPQETMSITELATAALNLRRAEAASTKTIVELVSRGFEGGKTEEEIETEIQSIRNEGGAIPSEFLGD